MTPARVIAVFQVAFVAYWAFKAIGVKRSVGPRHWSREIGLRLALVAIIVFTLRVRMVRHLLLDAQAQAAGNLALGLVGVILCALGFGLAMTARTFLGRNWGVPMSRKARPELVTTGPYARVRHPIYGGLLLALIGSAIGQSIFWVLPLPFVAAYFIYSARREERLMMEQFPDQYPAYVKRTNMLLPFVF